jgi:hypothetical protein
VRPCVRRAAAGVPPTAARSTAWAAASHVRMPKLPGIMHLQEMLAFGFCGTSSSYRNTFCCQTLVP